MVVASSYNSAHIHLDALTHNLQAIKTLAPESHVLAMVKANAYGHGLIEVAKTLTQVDGFGVASFAEAMRLRAAQVDQSIVIMSAILTEQECQLAAENQFAVVVHHPQQLATLEKISLPSPITVWMMVDTGMHRLGFLPDQSQDAWQRLTACVNVNETLYLMTHLSDADNVHKSQTSEQINCFAQLSNKENVIKSIANSAGIVAWPEARSDWIRPGIMLYGVYPLLEQKGSTLVLKPAMTLRSKLIAVRELPAGAKVGYAGTWVCPEAMPVGVVGIGYGDGYPRHAVSGTPVMINGVQCPLVGRVSMDMITVDLRLCPQASVGDDVELWGKQLSVATVAEHAGTIAYDLLCGVTQRVNIHYEK